MPVSSFLFFHDVLFLPVEGHATMTRRSVLINVFRNVRKVVRLSRFSCDRFKGRCLSDVFVFRDMLFIHLSGKMERWLVDESNLWELDL